MLTKIFNNTRFGKFSNRYSQTFLQLIFDSIFILISVFLLFLIRFKSGVIKNDIQPGFIEYLLGSLIIWSFWVVLFYFSGLYKNWYDRSPFEELWKVMKVVFIGCIIIIFIIFSNTSSTPRLLFLIFYISMSLLITIGRFTIRRIEYNLRNSKIIRINTILLGTSKRIIDFYLRNTDSPSWGFEIKYILTFDNQIQEIKEYLKDSVPVLDYYTEFNNILNNFNPNELIIASDVNDHKILLDVVNDCAYNNVKVKIEPDLYDIFTGQAKTQNIYGIPLIEISTQLLKPWQELLKRLFDIVFSLLVLIVGLPFWILLGLLIKVDSKGPIFFFQPRVGKNNKPFKIYKFRSMVQNTGLNYTKVNDPRVTRFGKFIRKSHLDEVPQFLNVLLGDMSVVGPRPETVYNVKLFIDEVPHYRRRLIIRPGITGWWQVKYKPHVLDIEEISSRLKDDFYYIENMSLQFDIEIVIRTVWAVLKGHGQA